MRSLTLLLAAFLAMPGASLYAQDSWWGGGGGGNKPGSGGSSGSDPKAKPTVIKLKIQGLKDKETADAAAKALKKVEGVTGAKVDRDKGTADVTGDPSKDICEALMGELVKLDLKSQVVSPVHLVFEAKGSTWAGWDKRVEDATRKVPGVTWVDADSKKREVVVHHADPATLDIEAIKKAINSGLHKDQGEAKLKSHEEKNVDLSSVKDKSAAKKALEGLLGVVRVTLEGKKAKVLVEKDRLTDDDFKKAIDGK